MQTHISLGPYQGCLVHWTHNEGGEFALLALGGVYSGASWRKFSGQDAEPPSLCLEGPGSRPQCPHGRKHTHLPS